MTEQEILEIYQRAGAVWFFDYKGDPKAPHAELTSGLCSDGYVNSAPVLADPKSVQFLARQLHLKLHARGIYNVDWVIGSAYAAITLSYEVASQLGANHGFVKKDPANPKKMIWDGFIPGHADVLQCEDVVNTLGTVLEVRRAVDKGNPEPIRWLPDVATVVRWPTRSQGGLIDVISLVSEGIRAFQVWKPEDCPLCAAGSPRLRPKGQSWNRLMRKAA